MNNTSRRDVMEITLYAVVVLAIAIITSGFVWQYVLAICMIYMLIVVCPLAVVHWRKKAERTISMYLDVINMEKNPFLYINYNKLMANIDEPNLINVEGSHAFMTEFANYMLAKLICDLLKDSHIIRDAGITICMARGVSYDKITLNCITGSSDKKDRISNTEARYFVIAYAKNDRSKLNPIIIDPIGKDPIVTLEAIAKKAIQKDGLTKIIPMKKFSMEFLIITSGGFSVGFDNRSIPIYTESNVEAGCDFKIDSTVKRLSKEIWGGILW